uniref:BHLH domain-containing protein n=1 Tax=Heterorhabditis bacteriophora TaxID=37862 RepID=A0A1I7WBP2_HETBA
MSTQIKPGKNNQLRRNERERKRVHQVNHGFDLLRTRVPKASANKKLSKAETLREAVRYIQYLQSLLHTDGGYIQNGYSTPTCLTNSQFYPSDTEFDVYFPSQSLASQHISPPLSHSYDSSQQVFGNYGQAIVVCNRLTVIDLGYRPVTNASHNTCPLPRV